MSESSPGNRAALERAIGLAGDALGSTPSGLLSDFDGTLSPIVADPAAARLAEGSLEALETLAERLAVVAVITGRAATDARRMTGAPGMLIVGNHGTEWLEPGAEHPATATDAEGIRGRLEAVLDRLPPLAGVVLERKGLSATVHYRTAARPDEAREVILGSVTAAAEQGIDVREGRMSVELRPHGLGDKGSAARAIVRRHGLRGVVVLGDDVTDLDMFAAVADLRDQGELRAAIIAVGGADGETPPEVASAADALLADPAQVAALLRALAAR